MASTKTFYKQPSERLDYDIDFSDFFEESDLDEIASVDSVDITPGTGELPDLHLDAAALVFGDEPQRKVKLWLKGGEDGTQYKVSVLCITDNGREVETDFILKVKER